MRTTNPCRPLLIAAASLLLAGTACAQDAGPSAGKAPPASPQPSGEATPNGTADQAATTENTAEAAPAPYAGAYSIARWMRAIGGRICMGPKIDRTSRVSRPNISDAAQGWRVSVPTFASARVSAPPKRAHQQTTTEQNTAENTGEQAVATATESSE